MAGKPRILRGSGGRRGQEKEYPDWRDWRSARDSNPRYSYFAIGSPTAPGYWRVRSWLRAALQSLASARPDYGSDRTFDRFSTAPGRKADLPSTSADRPLVTRSGQTESTDLPTLRWRECCQASGARRYWDAGQSGRCAAELRFSRRCALLRRSAQRWPTSCRAGEGSI
jgi:hypothetical protein